MEYLMYGFEADIRQYEMREILGWLLAVSLLHLAAGNFIARRKVRNEYMKLIRLGRFSRWWHGLCMRVLCLCLAAAAVVFAISLVFQAVVWGRPFAEAWGAAAPQAFLLFFLNFCFLSTFQLMLVNLGQGEKLSFMLVTVIEVVSLYGGLIWAEGACWLPGSWRMYYRSNLFLQPGYSVAVTAVVQTAWIAVCGLLGYKVLRGRR